jgi:hypothetical protein
MIKAESVHSAPPKHVCNHPESSQDWLNAGDASSREVFEAAQAGTAGRGGLRQYVPTKILLSLTVALLFGSSLAACRTEGSILVSAADGVADHGDRGDHSGCR